MQNGSDVIDSLYNAASAGERSVDTGRSRAEMHFQHILAECGDQETTDHGVTSVWIQLQCVLYLSSSSVSITLPSSLYKINTIGLKII